MTFELGHYDDKKQKCQSHEIMLLEKEQCYVCGIDVFSYNPYDIVGYGSTKEEALEDYKKKFKYIMSALNYFSKILFEEDIATVDVDCFGKKIKH